MATNVFDDLLLKGIRSGQMPARNSTAREWFREKAKETGKVNESNFIRSMGKERMKNSQNSIQNILRLPFQ
jgi:hypothetical protein